MSYPLAIVGTGMISSLSDSAEGSAAVMRCAYNNHIHSQFYHQETGEPYLASYAHLSDDANLTLGVDRLVALGAAALSDLVKTCPTDISTIPLLTNFPQEDECQLIRTQVLEQDFGDKLVAALGLPTLSQDSVFFRDGRAGIVSAIQHAQSIIEQGVHDQVLILTVDSLVNHQRVAHYESWIDIERLFSPTNSNGFIPGEAAVALLVSKPDPQKIQTCITGTGLGTEPAPIGSGEVLRGNGLSQAIREAASDAGTQVCETEFRIANTNGEEYWFREASLAQSRTLEQKRPTHPLWHPADNIGEVGAAVGGAMIVMAHYAFEKHYAPGPKALCHISNDDKQRAAFILERSKV